ncbi:MAG: GNAT family N-acetyltransferase [Firmicutes bacterium]|nr:GNAT family N-acetyltransferase [Bacillota bacterium]
MAVTIRQAVPSDAGAIARLSRDDLGYDYPAEQTERKLQAVLHSSRDRVYVAEADGSVVGYIHANDYDLLYAPSMKNILGIAVSERYRREGVGKRLIGAVEDWARQTGAAGIRLVSGAQRTGAHAFYRSCGFGSEREQIHFQKVLEQEAKAP